MTAALGTGNLEEELALLQRRTAFAGEWHILRKHDRQLFLGHRYGTTLVAINDRNRRAPIALPRHAPVAQPIANGFFTPTFLFRVTGNLVFAGAIGCPAESSAVHHDAIVDVRLGHRFGGELTVIRLNDDTNRQTIFFGKFKIPLIMSGHGHDGAGAILHEHEVGQINRYVFASEKISAVGSGKNALFLAFLRPALRLAHVFKALDEGLDRFLLRRSLSKLEGQRMLDR